MKKLMLALAAVLTLASACGQDNAAEGAYDGMTPAQTKDEYHAEAATLSLAPGWAWPQEIKLDEAGPDGRPMDYQRGYGKTQANWYWYCSWGRTFLAAQGTQREEAYGNMQKIRDLFYYKVALLPADRVRFEKTLAEAGLGDTAEMANTITLNCPEAKP
jgi:hypothetical protein